MQGLTATLAGPLLSATVSGGLIELNQAAGPGSPQPLDWGSIAAANLTLSGDKARVAGTLSQLNIFDVISGGASFDISRTRVSTVSPNPILINAPLLAGTLTVSGTQQLTFGTSAFGLTIGGVTLNFASLADPNSVAKSWVALDAENLTATLFGPGIHANVTGGLFRFNQGLVNENALQPDEEKDAPPLDWSQSGLTGAGIPASFNQEMTVASGTVSGLNLFDIVTGGATFNVSATRVSITDPALVDAPLLTGAFSVSGGQHLQLGTAAFGVNISSGSLHFASINDPKTAGKRWFGLEATNLSAQLNAPGLHGAVTNGLIQVNKASGSGAIGISNENVDPTPSSDRTQIRPWWPSTTCRAIARPRPVPPPRTRARSTL